MNVKTTTPILAVSANANMGDLESEKIKVAMSTMNTLPKSRVRKIKRKVTTTIPATTRVGSKAPIVAQSKSMMYTSLNR